MLIGIVILKDMYELFNYEYLILILGYLELKSWFRKLDILDELAILIKNAKSNSNESCQKWGVKYHFTTLNSVLTPLNSAFPLMVGAKMGCHFNNSMFF